MKTKLMIACLALMAFATSCKDSKEDTFLTTSVTLLEFENGGGSKTFTVSSNADWAVTTTENWISLLPAQGSGGGEVTVSVADQLNPATIEGVVTVRTDDGTNTINVTIKLKGIVNYPSSDERVLRSNNTANYIHFNDSKGDVDSLVIMSNIAWDIKGPEWIEAWDGQRWRPLSMERSNVYGSGAQTVFVRTALSNNEIYPWEGQITISERLSGNYAYNIVVRQTSSKVVLVNKGIALTTGFGMNWKCGSEVKSFYYLVSEKIVDVNTILHNKDYVRNNWKKATPGSGVGWDGLKENSDYYLMTVSEESLSTDDIQMFTMVLHTGSSSNQPMASITDIVLYDDLWYAQAQMNEYALAYISWGGGNDSYGATFNDPLFAYYLWTLMMKNSESISYWTGSGYFPFLWDNPAYTYVSVSTWAIGNDGHLSTIIDRKKRSTNTSTTRGFSPKGEDSKLKDYLSKEELDTMKAEIIFYKGRSIVGKLK